MTSSSDYARLHFIVFLWGFSAILGKLISIPFVEMVFFRAIFAIAGIGLVMYFRKKTFHVTPRDFVILVLIGFIVALHWLAFFGSGRVANVSVSLVGFATNSLWTAVLEPVFNKTKIKKFEVVLGLIVLAGLYIIFSFDSILTAVGLTDMVLIMIIAVVLSIGIMIIFSGKISDFIHKHPSMEVLALGFLILIGFMLFLEGLHKEVPKGYIYFAIVFSMIIEMVNIRVRNRRKKAKEEAHE